MKRFRGGLVFEARRLLYQSTLGSRVIKKREEGAERRVWQDVVNAFVSDDTRLFTASSDATIKVLPCSHLRTLARH